MFVDVRALARAHTCAASAHYRHALLHLAGSLIDKRGRSTTEHECLCREFGDVLCNALQFFMFVLPSECAGVVTTCRVQTTTTRAASSVHAHAHIDRLVVVDAYV